MSSIQLKKTNQKKKKKTTSLNTLPQESSIIHIGTVWATTQSPVRASVFFKKKNSPFIPRTIEFGRSYTNF